MINALSKFKTFFLSLLIIASTLSAIQGSCCELTQETEPCYFFQPFLEVKTGYFFFSNSKLRKIYDRGGLDIQLCAAYPLWNPTSRWTLNVYGAVEYFHTTGKSIHGHKKTSLWSVPINIGIKPVYAINACMQYYFAVGPRYFSIHQNNHSSYVYRTISKNGFGFFVNTGFYRLLYDQYLIDIFGEYSYGKTHFHGGRSHVYTRNIQIGGFTFGGGLGF